MTVTIFWNYGRFVAMTGLYLIPSDNGFIAMTRKCQVVRFFSLGYMNAFANWRPKASSENGALASAAWDCSQNSCCRSWEAFSAYFLCSLEFLALLLVSCWLFPQMEHTILWHLERNTPMHQLMKQKQHGLQEHHQWQWFQLDEAKRPHWLLH